MALAQKRRARRTNRPRTSRGTARLCPISLPNALDGHDGFHEQLLSLHFAALTIVGSASTCSTASKSTYYKRQQSVGEGSEVIVATADNLDLPTAWKRMRADRPDRAFTTHRHLFDVIEKDLEGWFSIVRERVNSGFYPSESVVLDIPKPNWLVRPAHIVTLEDELIYTGLLGTFHGPIWERLKWSQGGPDIAYRLSSPSKTPNWVQSGLNVWEDWRVKSLAAVTHEVFFVLTTDVTGYYENIDHNRLASDLKSLNLPQNLHSGLMTYLARWAGPRGKGIPQGYSASDILAKLYMDPVDRVLKNAGFTHLRYVDDIRVFCRTMLEAKNALLKLNELVRNRGLNLQSSKTRILKAEEAKHEIDGVAPQIQSITAQISKELKELGLAGMVYGTLKDLERYLAKNPDAPPQRSWSERSPTTLFPGAMPSTKPCSTTCSPAWAG